ncbi:EXLDI protein [Paenibacillus agricola]|uniref:EXLDI protein n=1 Tax=Paenibacillus agricola TaxID=2716264 RepID=A0ABX0J9N2_9BACL|nr:EXLDI protein [Paenibacillus agricola]NHN32852.1 EXLDI protein [Paenibacillus agricola]
MPNKTIYVSDTDLLIFERAQELAGENLSATITEALRRYVKNAEAKAEGLEEIIVKVGKVAITSKRFWGRLLAKGQLTGENKEDHQWYTVYNTAKGAFAVYITNHPKWWYDNDIGTDMKWKDADNGTVPYWMKKYSDDPARNEAWKKKKQAWSIWHKQPEYTLEVYTSLEELKEHVVDELYQAAFRALQDDPIEDLDI